MAIRAYLHLWITTVSLLGATVASAQNCDAVLLDDGNLLSTSAEQNTLMAAQAVSDQGFDVRVRTSDYFVGDNLQDHIGQFAQANCPEWLVADALRGDLFVLWVTTKPRLIDDAREFVIATSPESDISQVVLGRIKADMQDDLMAGRRDVVFENALVSLDTHLTQLATSVQSAPIIVYPSTTQPVTIQTEPTNYAPLAWIVVLLLGAGGFFGWFRFNGGRKQRQRATADVFLQGRNVLQDLNPIHERVTAHMENLKSVLSASLATEMEREWTLIIADAESAMDLYNDRCEQFNLTQDEEDALTGELSIEDVLNHVGADFHVHHEALSNSLTEIQSIESAMKEFEGKVRDYLKLVEELPTIRSTLEDELKQAEARIAAVAEAGFSVRDANAHIAAIKQTMSAGETAAEAKNLVSAKQHFRQAAEAIPAAIEAAERLPREKQRLSDLFESTQLMLGKVEAQVAPTHELVKAMMGVHHEDSYADILGNGTEAEDRLDHVADVLPEMRDDPTDQSNWSTFEGDITTIAQTLGEAEHLLRAIKETYDRLEKARVGVPDMIAEVHRSVQAGLDFISTQKADVDFQQHKTVLEKVQRDVQALQVQLHEPRPNYVSIMKQAIALDDVADKALRIAEDEHATVKRERAQAKALITEAIADIDAAERYINSHRRDVDGGAHNHLRNAREELRQAGNEDVLAARISFARSAVTAAESALDSAQRDVRTAEQKREAVRVAASTVTVLNTTRQQRTFNSNTSWGTPTRTNRPARAAAPAAAKPRVRMKSAGGKW